MKATVLVRPKEGILDPQGDAVQNSLRHLGFAVADARVGRVVEIEVDASDAASARAEVERMCDRIHFLSAGEIIATGDAAELADEYGAADLEEVFLKVART